MLVYSRELNYLTKLNMTKANKQKRRSNPLLRNQARVPRPVSQFDGSMLNGSHLTNLAVATLNEYTQAFYVNCQTGFGVAAQNAPLLGFYNEYKYQKLSMGLVPNHGPGAVSAAGRIYIAYVDNPELITNWNALASSALRLDAIKGMRDMRAYNLWERFVYNIPLGSRRKQFDVDVNPAGVTVDILDRTTQGAVLIAAETVGPADPIGRFRFLYTIRMHGLTNTLST